MITSPTSTTIYKQSSLSICVHKKNKIKKQFHFIVLGSLAIIRFGNPRMKSSLQVL